MMGTQGRADNTLGVRQRWGEATRILRTALRDELGPCGFEDAGDGDAVVLTRERLPDARHGITVGVWGTTGPMFSPSAWVACPVVETLLGRIGVHSGPVATWRPRELSADGGAWEFLEPAPGETERVSRALAAFLARSIAPCLDKYWNLGALYDAYTSRAGDSIACLVLAALKHSMGEKREARRILEEFIAQSHLPASPDETLYPHHMVKELHVKSKAKALLALIEGSGRTP